MVLDKSMVCTDIKQKSLNVPITPRLSLEHFTTSFGGWEQLCERSHANGPYSTLTNISGNKDGTNGCEMTDLHTLGWVHRWKDGLHGQTDRWARIKLSLTWTLSSSSTAVCRLRKQWLCDLDPSLFHEWGVGELIVMRCAAISIGFEELGKHMKAFSVDDPSIGMRACHYGENMKVGNLPTDLRTRKTKRNQFTMRIEERPPRSNERAEPHTNR